VLMLKVVLIDSDHEARLTLRRMLVRAHATVVAEYETVGEALMAAPSHHPDVAIVEVTDNEAAADVVTARTMQRLAQTLPDTAIFATGPVHSAEFVIQVMRAGSLEYLARPVVEEDLSAALAKIGRTRRVSAPAGRKADIIALFSASGGVGVTTLAISLAMAMAENQSKRVLLVELDTRPSDVMTFLDIRPPYSVADALHNIDRMDESFIQGLVVKYDNGLFVLTAPPRYVPEPLEPKPVSVMLEILRSHFDYIIIDCRHDYDTGTLTALDVSDTILLLAAPNVASIRSAASAVAALRQTGIDPAKIKPIISRERTGVDVDTKHVKETLGLPIFWATPNDYASTVSAINHGRPLMSGTAGSKLMASVRGLGERLSAPGKSAKAPHRKSLLRRLSWKS
jgi:pilus assembly protein CpaE